VCRETDCVEGMLLQTSGNESEPLVLKMRTIAAAPIKPRLGAGRNDRDAEIEQTPARLS